ncbi:DUF2971 domain-containing protein [Vibrio maritimus]|uniref:DUF2971 domain-containing protein n=1 Tax=Vibrio maritimus TaxID=990268 RepID=UPI00406767DC
MSYHYHHVLGVCSKTQKHDMLLVYPSVKKGINRLGSSVFKFSAGKQIHLDALANNKVYFSSINELNDPYEGLMAYSDKGVTQSDAIAALTQVHMKTTGSIGQARKVVLNLQKKLGKAGFNSFVDEFCQNEIDNFVQYHRDHQFVLSLAMAYDNDLFPSPLNSMMMWGHYGNGLRGMCVEYDFTIFKDSITQLNGHNLTSKKVTYQTTELPIVRATTLLNDLTTNTHQTSIEILDAFCTKNRTWDYENEVRLIGEKAGLNDIDCKAIKRVFVAARNTALMADVKTILKAMPHKPELPTQVISEIYLERYEW